MHNLISEIILDHIVFYAFNYIYRDDGKVNEGIRAYTACEIVQNMKFKFKFIWYDFLTKFFYLSTRWINKDNLSRHSHTVSDRRLFKDFLVNHKEYYLEEDSFKWEVGHGN